MEGRGVSGFWMKESGCRVPSGEFHKSKSTLFLLSFLLKDLKHSSD